MTDGRFSGGSVGLVIGHVGPEAAVGGPIGLIEEDDDVIVDLNINEINCLQLNDTATHKERKSAWDAAVAGNGGTHPAVGDASTRLLNRMRCSAVSAVQGAGMHPGGSLWVSEPRAASRTGFTPSNTHRDG
jgi:dihydroxy-acid dehydratase